MTQAVILAGGKGTRLAERLGDLPKPLVDIGGSPLLEHQIALVKAYGFSDVLILVNHAAQHIVDYCAAKRNWGLRIDCVDDGTPRGTAGATLAVFDRLASEFLVIYGDTMLNVDLNRFHAFHGQGPGAAATLFLHPNDHPHDSDLIEIGEDGRILAFHPYPHEEGRDFPNLVNAALYWVNRQALASWRQAQGVFDFGRHLFPAMLRSGLYLRGYRSPEYIKDIGTPSRLDRVRADFLTGRIERASLTRTQAIAFIDRDGTLNREVDHLRDVAQFDLLPGVADAIRRLNQSDYRTCVVTNQPVIARGECSDAGLRRIHDRMESLLGRQGAYIDRIYYCPHHPDGGFAGERPELKIDCDCRKPKTGMIERAMGDFNGARERSWLIGDSSIETETARRAGLRSILVETGYAGLDYRAWATPFATVPDLPAAVAFILDQYPRLLEFCSGLARGIGAGAMVLIGGQARSGKSIFASVLRDAMQAMSRGSLVLCADRWLRSERQRTPGVLGRYDMSGLQAMVEILSAGNRRPNVLTLPGYHKLKRERVEAVERQTLSAGDIIVVEGTIALALETGVSVETHRFYVDIGEEERKQRIVREYRLRGSDERQALEVYTARLHDEFPAVEAMARGARRFSLSSVWGVGSGTPQAMAEAK